MYEPEWLTWWKSLQPEVKNYLMSIFFDNNWNANPMNYMIKYMYKFHIDQTFCN